MEAFTKLLEVSKFKVNDLWLDLGIPFSLLEPLGAHLIEEILIAVKLAAFSGCDVGKVVYTTVARELGKISPELATSSNKVEEDSLENCLANLAHELAVVLQAKRYARMGFNVEQVLKEHAARALAEAAKVGKADALQTVHDVLTV
ncbi:MAG: hypothetical protein QXY49_02820 [Thermofilaceae archaeon]